ncbi:MAG: hypothetical protein RIA69_13930 [Cyclobacteriaceae bacterium]|uniref:hypothetical protein n=1 Tax=Fulvivirga sp. TaxID=1931237 RepID=UPI0032EC139C
MKIDKIYTYSVLIIVSASIVYLYQKYLLTDIVIEDHLVNQMSLDRIQELLKFRDKYSWINYATIPITYLFKFTALTSWILCATILFGYKNTFHEIFRIVMVAEFVWLIPSILTLIWFGFIDTDYTLLDIQYFKPLSLISIFDTDEIEGWLVFPLQALNLFEVVYMLVLAIGFKRILKKDYISALDFTLPVYGTALITWIVFVTFLSINLST